MSESNLQPSEPSLHKPSERRVYTVSAITREIRQTLETGFGPLFIEGEISNFTHHGSGHMYFSLKDAEAQISCVFWRGRNQSLLFKPEDGMKVIVAGKLTLYERQGRYQIDVDRILPAGVGEMQIAFEALKKRLDEEGLFDPEAKKPIPPYPERIGIVTSATGAAIRDITTVVRRRFRSVQLILYPVRVQGTAAAEEIAAGIDVFNRYGEVDVLIVGRGGGSLEDLWAFNEEVVARSIHRSRIPVISAVGHEIDFSISDFTADVRAPTPSAAAEIAVQDSDGLLRTVILFRDRMVRILRDRIRVYADRLDAYQARYGLRRPRERINEYRLRLDDISRSLTTSMSRLTEISRLRLDRTLGRLEAMNPEAVLRRGYSITTRVKDGGLVTDALSLDADEKIRVQLARGAVRSVVETVEPPKDNQ